MSLQPPDGRIPHSAHARPDIAFQENPMIVRRNGRYLIL
jgi:hypothetical protein